MPRKKRAAALLAFAALIAAAAGCGSNQIEGTIPELNASRMSSDLDAIQSASTSGDCDAAEAGAQDFLQQVNDLPATAGAELKQTLRDAASQLRQLVQDPCAAGATGATGPQSRKGTAARTTQEPSAGPPPITGAPSTPSVKQPSSGSDQGGSGNQSARGNPQGAGNQGASNQGGGSTGGGGTSGGTGGTGVGGGGGT